MDVDALFDNIDLSILPPTPGRGKKISIVSKDSSGYFSDIFDCPKTNKPLDKISDKPLDKISDKPLVKISDKLLTKGLNETLDDRMSVVTCQVVEFISISEKSEEQLQKEMDAATSVQLTDSEARYLKEPPRERLFYIPVFSMAMEYKILDPGVSRYMSKDKFIELFAILKKIEGKRPKIRDLDENKYNLTCKWESKEDSTLGLFLIGNKTLKNIIVLAQYNISKLSGNVCHDFHSRMEVLDEDIPMANF